MSEMVERVARALACEDSGKYMWDDGRMHDGSGLDALDRNLWRRLACAAIEAMRPLLESAREEIRWWADEHRCCSGDAAEIIAEIDAVLSKTTEAGS